MIVENKPVIILYSLIWKEDIELYMTADTSMANKKKRKQHKEKRERENSRRLDRSQHGGAICTIKKGHDIWPRISICRYRSCVFNNRESIDTSIYNKYTTTLFFQGKIQRDFALITIFLWVYNSLHVYKEWGYRTQIWGSSLPNWSVWLADQSRIQNGQYQKCQEGHDTVVVHHLDFRFPKLAQHFHGKF